MNPAMFLLASAWIPGQAATLGANYPQPPHQPLWTCSSMLKCRNVMSCHPVGEVSLPYLDCWARFLDCLCPRKRRYPIRLGGVTTAPMYPYNMGPGQHSGEFIMEGPPAGSRSLVEQPMMPVEMQPH